MAEAKACLDAIQWCLEQGFSNIAVFIDNLLLVKFLSKDTFPDVWLTCLISDILRMANRGWLDL